MAATNIGTDGTHKYPLAKMPVLSDAADIQIALRNYHYGQDTPLASGATPTAGIAKYLYDIEASIAAISTDASTVVQESVIDAKGDLFVGTANNALDNLTVGSDGYILTADSAQGTFGLKWAAPAAASTSTPGVSQLSDSTSETSSVKAATPTAVKAAYDKASTAATTSVVGIVQLSDSTSETSSIKAATPTAVKAAYDKASTAATTSVAGIVQLSDSTSETSSVLAATPTAVSTLKQTVDSSTKTANYTLDPADAGKIIVMNVSSSTSIITIPLETTFPAGARVDILQIGSVQTSIAPVSGSVTLNSKNNNRKLSGQYSAATLIKVGTNSWVLLGDLTA
jgi:hypothetical protein